MTCINNLIAEVGKIENHQTLPLSSSSILLYKIVFDSWNEDHSLVVSCGLTCVMTHLLRCCHLESMQEFPVTGAVLHARHVRKAVRHIRIF